MNTKIWQELAKSEGIRHKNRTRTKKLKAKLRKVKTSTAQRNMENMPRNDVT
jgi:hypothetical protein